MKDSEQIGVKKMSARDNSIDVLLTSHTYDKLGTAFENHCVTIYFLIKLQSID